MNLESKITFFGHPLHAMLVVFPLGLLFTSFLFDLIYAWRKEPFWGRGAFWMIAVGEAGALASVLTGWLDYLSIPMPLHARQAATLHLYLGLGVVALYGLQLWVRRRHSGESTEGRAHSPAVWALALVSVGAVGLQGWVGGEVSHVHGVGVLAERKRPDAPAPQPFPAGERPQPISGREVYRRVCAGCHGAQGEGGIGSRLADTAHPHDTQDIARIVRSGKPPMMPAFKADLSAEEVDAVAVYVRSLMRGGTGEPASGNG